MAEIENLDVRGLEDRGAADHHVGGGNPAALGEGARQLTALDLRRINAQHAGEQLAERLVGNIAETLLLEDLIEQRNHLGAHRRERGAAIIRPGHRPASAAPGRASLLDAMNLVPRLRSPIRAIRRASARLLLGNTGLCPAEAMLAAI